MSLAFSIQASVSAGNSTLVLLESTVESRLYHPRVSLPARRAGLPSRSCVLLDAGLSPRRTARHLKTFNLTLDDVEAIVLTHLDSDHFHGGWRKFIAQRAETGSPLTLHVHRRHRNAAWSRGLTARHTALFEEDLPLPFGATAQPVLLAHDDLGSVGFVVEHDGHRLGYATDLGRVHRAMLQRFVNLHALAIESNYDPPMQRESLRPAFLKRRIMGGSGHLSNQQALEAVREIEQRSRLSHIALLHLSEECNCPKHVRRLWQREMPHAVERLTITHQRRPTPLMHVRPAAAPCRITQPLLFEFAGAIS
jgi:phosphoribosyl 1,2-cyclic phosphodiesterase